MRLSKMLAFKGILLAYNKRKIIKFIAVQNHLVNDNATEKNHRKKRSMHEQLDKLLY